MKINICATIAFVRPNSNWSGLQIFYVCYYVNLDRISARDVCKYLIKTIGRESRKKIMQISSMETLVQNFIAPTLK